MTAQPLVSIVILSQNGLDDTRHCITSVFGQTYPFPVEVIIIDNGSERDETQELVRQFGDRVVIIRNASNVGVAAGFNQGVRAATGKYVVLLNNDTEVTHGWLLPLVDLMDCQPDVAACQPKIRSMLSREMFDYSGACGGFLDRYGYPFLRGRIMDTCERDTGQYDQPMEIHWSSGACMMIRKNVWQDIGGADEAFFAYMEEVDACWRMRRRGYRVMVVPQSVIFHKGAVTWRRKLPLKRYYEHRNNLLMLLKNLEGDQLWTVLLIRICLELFSLGYYLLTGQWRFAISLLTAWGSVLRLLPRSLRMRTVESHVVSLRGPCIAYEYFLRGRKTFARLPGIGAAQKRV